VGIITGFCKALINGQECYLVKALKALTLNKSSDLKLFKTFLPLQKQI
jgi:hypothetical protein